MANQTKWGNSLAEPQLPEFTGDQLRKAVRGLKPGVVKWGPPKGKEIW